MSFGFLPDDLYYLIWNMTSKAWTFDPFPDDIFLVEMEYDPKRRDVVLTHPDDLHLFGSNITTKYTNLGTLPDDLCLSYGI